MINLDFNSILVNLNNKPLVEVSKEDGKEKKTDIVMKVPVANVFLNPHEFSQANPVKWYEYAIKVNKDGILVVSSTDFDEIIKVLTACKIFSLIVTGQIIKILKKQKEIQESAPAIKAADEEKKEG